MHSGFDLPGCSHPRWRLLWALFFFFQAEDGIRDVAVTGVQTCALPISKHRKEIAEIIEWTEMLIVGKVEHEIGVHRGLLTIQPPLVAVGENGPIEEP